MELSIERNFSHFYTNAGSACFWTTEGNSQFLMIIIIVSDFNSSLFKWDNCDFG